MIEVLFLAHEVNREIIAFIDKIVAECGKKKTHLRERQRFRNSCLLRSRRS